MFIECFWLFLNVFDIFWSFPWTNITHIGQEQILSDPSRFRLQRCPCFQTTRPQRGQHKVCCDCWGAMIRNGSGVGGFKWLQRCVVHVDLPIVPWGRSPRTCFWMAPSLVKHLRTLSEWDQFCFGLCWHVLALFQSFPSGRRPFVSASE